MYNTLIGVAAGFALLVPRAFAHLHRLRMPLQGTGRRPFDPGGWAATLAALGAVLILLGFVMTVTHPLGPVVYVAGPHAKAHAHAFAIRILERAGRLPALAGHRHRGAGTPAPAGRSV